MSSFSNPLTITEARHLLYVVCRVLGTYSDVIKRCSVIQLPSPQGAPDDCTYPLLVIRKGETSHSRNDTWRFVGPRSIRRWNVLPEKCASSGTFPGFFDRQFRYPRHTTPAELAVSGPWLASSNQQCSGVLPQRPSPLMLT